MASTNPNQPLAVINLRGGQNDSVPPLALADDEVVLARNVEFFKSMLGERRNGCGPMLLTGSTLASKTAIVHISEWFPQNDITNPEAFIAAATPGVSVVMSKGVSGVMTDLAPTDAFNTTAPDIYGIQTQPMNGKLFISYRSAQDRMHVYDGTTLRRAGLAQPSPPTAANQGVGTAYNHTRFFRVRYVIRSGATVLARSEPSTTLTFTPNGTSLSGRVTRPALLGEGETDWEVEASEDNATFYRMSTVATATTTYDDTIDVGNSITTTGVTIPTGYVQLTDKAAARNLLGGTPNGAYSNGATFPLRGWVGYNGSGVYIVEGSWTSPPAVGDVYFASQDVATAIEAVVAFNTTYAATGFLSEAIGEYLLLPSAKYIGVDGDRLIFAGHWTDLTKQSQVGWSPVHNDPGVGNDERLPLSVNNTVMLDNFDGGGVTGLATGVVGTWYVFKWAGIYKMTRTGDVTRAYTPQTISQQTGAIPGSIVRAVDESGASCIYFLDPAQGPSRIAQGGIQTIEGLRTTWGRVNLQAANIVSRGCYYPLKQQVHWWVAVDGASSPNFKIVVQVTELRPQTQNSVKRGLATWTGRITEAFAVGVLTETVSISGVLSLSKRPFVGMTAPDCVQRCDTESTDAGIAYVATIRTRPYMPRGLLSFWGAMTASLLATAHASASVVVKFLRDFSVETTQITTTLAPSGAEVYVIKDFDNLSMSEARAIQVEITDV